MSPYQRWAGTVPEDFRFAVKTPKEITHARRLVAAEQPLAQFLSKAGMLGAKLGPLLVQLPPSLLFEEETVMAFFRRLRSCFGGLIACEPRHATWFTDEVDLLLSRFQVARAAADPACVRRGAAPGGWPGLVYYRLTALRRSTTPPTELNTSLILERGSPGSPQTPKCGASSTTRHAAKPLMTSSPCSSNGHRGRRGRTLEQASDG